MKELLLGLRLLLGSGRGNRVRFALMSVGGSIGVCCLAIVLTIPGILAAQDARVAARQPVVPRDESHRPVFAGFPLLLERTEPYGSRPLTRIFLARGSKDVGPPPGLSSFPRVGQVFVSPRLHQALRAEPNLAQRLPGRESGLIGHQGLARPEELVAYVGVRRGELSDGTPVVCFGAKKASERTVDPATLGILRFTMVGIVLVPLAVFLSVCARLSAAERARRLAALRLLGMSGKGVQRVNAAETVAAAGLGSLLGLGAYWGFNQLVSRIGLPGFSWYPSDGAPTNSTIVACLLGCPALAWAVGRVSARKAAANPLAVRRTAPEKLPSAWGFVPLLAGSGIAAGYCVAGATGRVPTDTGSSVLLIPSMIVLIGVGLVTILPRLSRALAGRIARSTHSLALGLAMRRNEAEPGGALRVAAGLVVLVFAASLAQGVLIELDQVSKNTSPIQDYDMRYAQLTAAQRQSLERLPGVRAHIVTMESSLVGGSEMAWSPQVVLATCRQLRSAVPWVGECVDRQPLRLTNTKMPQDGPADVGKKLVLRLGGGHRDVPITVPKRTVPYHEFADSWVLGSQAILVPPSELPASARPESATLTLISASDPDTVRRVLDGIGHVAPTIEVIPQGLNITALQQIAVVKTLLALGMVLGAVIGVAAYVVAATDRAVERRPQVTALALLGARPRTLRAVQVTQVVLPLSVGLLLAVALGKMAESSYLVTGGGTVFWDGAGLPLLLAGTLGVVAVAALGSLPLVGRRIDPELIRRD
ncbi:FtsX-like permease family protein [Streptomyces puniciscabiei]|uniref:FtsX-like permease family protein n=1 Tax=Streptomyces puniciscabiei TaxID=164348 RepID=A0A542UJT8_9ACTN|nr:FtsX-like permease family protein [Streptomyces puniciscabiei]TQK99334.1 FtsX-like permease family protein [Streptomyces puniciscabiei]